MRVLKFPYKIVFLRKQPSAAFCKIFLVLLITALSDSYHKIFSSRTSFQVTDLLESKRKQIWYDILQDLVIESHCFQHFLVIILSILMRCVIFIVFG